MKSSRKDPFYELVQYSKNTKFGVAVGGRQPVNKPKCMKNWFHEYIMLIGGEWEYMPGFRVDCPVSYKVPSGLHTQEVYEWLHDLINAFDKPLEVSTFYRVDSLKQHNREYSWVFTSLSIVYIYIFFFCLSNFGVLFFIIIAVLFLCVAWLAFMLH